MENHLEDLLDVELMFDELKKIQFYIDEFRHQFIIEKENYSIEEKKLAQSLLENLFMNINNLDLEVFDFLIDELELIKIEYKGLFSKK
jgi:hypothetical protein